MGAWRFILSPNARVYFYDTRRGENVIAQPARTAASAVQHRQVELGAARRVRQEVQLDDLAVAHRDAADRERATVAS
jgi:hypothetical protein